MAEVSFAALSFPKGSGAGPSGMRPEHFKSVLKNTSAALVNKALTALTRLVNTMAAGKVPERVRPFLCGARLVAGKKKDNSLRPIAIGNLLRRVVAKCFTSALADKAAALLAPQQSTIGAFLATMGPNTFAPSSAARKKQTCARPIGAVMFANSMPSGLLSVLQKV